MKRSHCDSRVKIAAAGWKHNHHWSSDNLTSKKDTFLSYKFNVRKLIIPFKTCMPECSFLIVWRLIRNWTHSGAQSWQAAKMYWIKTVLGIFFFFICSVLRNWLFFSRWIQWFYRFFFHYRWHQRKKLHLNQPGKKRSLCLRLWTSLKNSFKIYFLRTNFYSLPQEQIESTEQLEVELSPRSFIPLNKEMQTSTCTSPAGLMKLKQI